MIKGIVSSIRHNIRADFLTCIIGLYALAMVIPPLPFLRPVYYIILVALFVYMLYGGGKINGYNISFIIAAVISIVVSDPPAIFRSWERLGLLIIVMGATSSLFRSPTGTVLTFKLLQVTLWLFVGVGISSFACYLLGINYMQMWAVGKDSFAIAGGFGGITQQSMILGPLSAFGAIFLTCKLLYGHFQKISRSLLWIGVALCCISTLLSASRSALLCLLLGLVMVLYFRYKNISGKFFKNIVLVIAVLLLSYPLYSDFAQGVITKQQANEASGGTFSSRDVKWTNRIAEFEKSPLCGIGFASISLDTEEGGMTNRTGVVEPGSSWLAVLSMTGILGAIPIALLLIGTLFRLFKKIRIQADYNFVVLFILLFVSIVHQFFEGYALAGGSYLCFFFWLLLGAADGYGRQSMTNPNIDFNL